MFVCQFNKTQQTGRDASMQLILMKTQCVFKTMARAAASLAAVGAVAILASSVSATPPPSGEVLSPTDPQYGFSYQEWSAKFWEWSLSQATNHVEKTGASGVCTGPASRVRFLNVVDIPGTGGGVSVKTNKLSIERDTPLFFPILSVYDDNTTCPVSAFGSLTAAELTDTNASMWTAVTVTSCSIDGVAVAGLEDPATTEYLVVSPPFSYTTAEKDNVLAGFFGEPCIPGDLTVYPAVAEGVFLMISPLSPGKHTIHCIGVVGPATAPFVEENITYEITVLPE
jgi:hypothetical protein